jgi:hypothetical protein
LPAPVRGRARGMRSAPSKFRGLLVPNFSADDAARCVGGFHSHAEGKPDNCRKHRFHSKLWRSRLMGAIGMLRQIVEILENKRGISPRFVRDWIFFLETFLLMFGSMDALPVSCGREPWVDQHLVDRIS